MSINTYLLAINGTTLTDLCEYKVGRNKLWSDADRNMNGDVRATLIGLFPKVEVKFNYLTEEEMVQVTTLLDEAYFSLTYYDPRTKSTHTAKYYASDYTVELDSKQKGRYKPFSVSLVPCSKRTY